MKKFFVKIPIVAIAIIVGVCSVSLTVYAYYRLQYSVGVSAIQTASAEMLVKIVTSDTQAVVLSDEEECYIESYKFSGTEGEDGVTFCVVCGGTASNGYCEVIVKDIEGNQKSYYTPAITKGVTHSFKILGNKDTEVQFISHWGTHDITDEALLIAAEETLGTFVLSPSPSPSVSPSPSPSPSVSPSPSASASPSPSPSETPSPSPTPSASPSATPDVSASPEASATPSEAPDATPTPTAEVSGSETPSPTPEVEVSETPSSSPEVDVSATPSPTPEDCSGVEIIQDTS